jgi:hypothetical protein
VRCDRGAFRPRLHELGGADLSWSAQVKEELAVVLFESCHRHAGPMLAADKLKSTTEALSAGLT